MNARSEYLENAVRGASPLGLVVMLYEQLVEDLRRATAALEAGQIDRRTHAVNHAILILGQLQGRLNHEAGGEVARNLDHFYDVIREKLFEAHVSQSKSVLSELMTAVLEVRGAWQEAERAQRGVEKKPAAADSVSNAATEAGPARVDLKG